MCTPTSIAADGYSNLVCLLVVDDCLGKIRSTVCQSPRLFLFVVCLGFLFGFYLSIAFVLLCFLLLFLLSAVD